MERPESLKLYHCKNGKYKCRINTKRKTVRILPFYSKKGTKKGEWTHHLTMSRVD